ncbi:unnamed protein product [Leuciscus chuanchicus]
MPALHRTNRVCSAHFHSSQFKRPSDVHGGLKWDAVPTKIEAPNPPPPLDVERKLKPPKTRQELPRKKRKQSHVPPPSKDQHTGEAVVGPSSRAQYTEEAVAGPSSMEEGDIEDVSAAPSSVQRHVHTAAVREHSLTMKIRALKTQVSKLRSKVKQLRQTKVSRAGDKERVMKELQHLLPAKAFAFVRTQLRMSRRKCHGYRWTTQDKAFFLSLWHASPKCYRLLCRVFSMPSVRTLQKTIQAADFKTGFNNTVLATMKKAMETNKPIDKLCAIITDEMSLKEALHYDEAADRVEGFEDFGRGQRTPYVANYASAFMVRGLLTKWKQLFGYCFTSGPIPHTQLQSILVDGIRELRKAGMECLVFICDQVAGNRAMLTRLGVTKEQPFFSVDGIRKHVHLPPFASMRVRFTTQVLSHSVAVGIKTLADIKGLTGQCQQNYLAAARFCENFNGLFDCFNSKLLKDSQKLKCAISDASSHFAFLDKCMEWLPRLRLVGGKCNKKQIPCVEGWQHNIVCLKMLWSDLRQRHPVSFLLTNRLNQDCLENAYSSIRARGGNRDNPDSVQFECEYRAVATGLMFSNSEKTNCEQDLDMFLLQFSAYASQESPLVNVDPESIMEEHGYSFDHDGNVLVYIAGYIADKVLGKFTDPEGPCKECTLLSTNVPTDSRYTFLKDKQYTDLVLGEKGLKVPSTALVDLLTALESNFRKHISSVIHSVGLGKKLFTSSMEVVRDRGYPLKTWLLTPLTNPQTDRECRYNDAHSRTRSVVERAIGQLKCRWRCLDRTGGMLLYRPVKVCHIVLACGVLHNVTHRHGIPLGEVAAPPDDPDPGPITACVKTRPDGRASALGEHWKRWAQWALAAQERRIPKTDPGDGSLGALQARIEELAVIIKVRTQNLYKQTDSKQRRHKIRKVILDEKKCLAATICGYNNLAEPSEQIVSTDASVLTDAWPWNNISETAADLHTKRTVFEKVMAVRRLKEEEVIICKEMQQHWTAMKAQSMMLATLSSNSSFADQPEDAQRGLQCLVLQKQTELKAEMVKVKGFYRRILSNQPLLELEEECSRR